MSNAKPAPGAEILQTIQHSMQQAQIVGNDWRREVAMTLALVSNALTAAQIAESDNDPDMGRGGDVAAAIRRAFTTHLAWLGADAWPEVNQVTALGAGVPAQVSAASDELPWTTILADYRALEADWNKLMTTLGCDDTASALAKIASRAAPTPVAQAEPVLWRYKEFDAEENAHSDVWKVSDDKRIINLFSKRGALVQPLGVLGTQSSLNGDCVIREDHAAPVAPSEPVAQTWKDCADCDGSGRISPSELCGRCNQSGLLPNAAPVAPSEPTENRDGWMIDGSLIYRLDDDGANCDEINVTMSHGSRAKDQREATACAIFNLICGLAAPVAQVSASPDTSGQRKVDCDKLATLVAWFLSGRLPKDLYWNTEVTAEVLRRAVAVVDSHRARDTAGQAAREVPDRVTITIRQQLADYLKLWEKTDERAPENELQSIQAWLSSLGAHGPEETANRMRYRMILLMKAAKSIHDAGSEAETQFGIYEKRITPIAKQDSAPAGSSQGAVLETVQFSINGSEPVEAYVGRAPFEGKGSAPAGEVAEADMNRLIAKRDHFEEMADKLAAAIAAHFGAEIGEHSSDNNPWLNALEIIATNATAQASPADFESFDIERTGEAHRDACDFLLNAAQQFWNACRDAKQYGAVQWLTGNEGQLLIYTRGEYRDRLLLNIINDSSAPEKHFAQASPAKASDAEHDIPNGVYFSASADNFYSMMSKQGMGKDFYMEWCECKAMFPQEDFKADKSPTRQSTAPAAPAPQEPKP